jgi:hypothetical protein
MISKRGKPPRPGSVLEYKSWCVTPPPNSKVITKSKKPYGEMSAEEKTIFCPPGDKVTSSLPALPPSPPDSDVEDKPLTAVQKLAARKADVTHIVGNKSSNETKAYIWYGRPVPKGGKSKKRSRKTKRKTHRRRR